MTTTALLEKVRGTPAFLAFSAIVGHRCLNGNVHSGLRMLVAAGLPPGQAYLVADKWPPLRRGIAAGLREGEAAACRLANHVGDISKYDWQERLRAAVCTG